MFDWLPDTEDRLREMLDQGLLFERHNLDFKRELTAGSGANKEHARDLAQFGPDGGVLAVGVDDDGQLTPIDLAGQRERIDQIARNIPDPPMHVRVVEIPATGQPGKGYLLVVVPPDGAHQVDGRYYGRGDTTKHVLSDAEVQALTQRALHQQRDAEDLLDEEVQQDPWPPIVRNHAHLFGVAQPISARSDQLQQVLKDPPGWHGFIHGKVRDGTAGQPLGDDWSPHGWSPDLPHASEISRRARGWALSSGIDPGRRARVPDGDPTAIARAEGYVLDLEVREDGGLRLFCGSASCTLTSRYTREEPTECVIDGLVLGLTKRLVLVATVVAEVVDYFGQWDFGIAATGLRGLQSLRLVQHGDGYLAAPFSENDYRQTVRTTYERLVKDPDSVVEDLTGRLNRALGGSAPIPQPPN